MVVHERTLLRVRIDMVLEREKRTQITSKYVL